MASGSHEFFSRRHPPTYERVFDEADFPRFSGSDVLIEAKLRLAEAKMFFAIKITHKPSHNIECYADPINMNLSLAMEMPSRTNFNLIGIRVSRRRHTSSNFSSNFCFVA